MTRKPIIAIDGPAGAGKSTIAKAVARELGLVYIDSGALYRALTWKALRFHANLHSPLAMAEIAKTTEITFKQDRNKNLKVFMDGRNVTAKIRSERVSLHTNEVAKVKGVRRILNDLQKRMGRRGGVVMEGRDIGTRIFPKARYKFFLDASPSERAMRRYQELKGKGKKVRLEKIAHALAQRDYKDKTRGISPLRQAPDAVVIDSTHLSLAQVARRILAHVVPSRAIFS